MSDRTHQSGDYKRPLVSLEVRLRVLFYTHVLVHPAEHSSTSAGAGRHLMGVFCSLVWKQIAQGRRRRCCFTQTSTKMMMEQVEATRPKFTKCPPSPGVNLVRSPFSRRSRLRLAGSVLHPGAIESTRVRFRFALDCSSPQREQQSHFIHLATWSHRVAPILKCKNRNRCEISFSASGKIWSLRCNYARFNWTGCNYAPVCRLLCEYKGRGAQWRRFAPS